MSAGGLFMRRMGGAKARRAHRRYTHSLAGLQFLISCQLFSVHVRIPCHLKDVTFQSANEFISGVI